MESELNRRFDSQSPRRADTGAGVPGAQAGGPGGEGYGLAAERAAAGGQRRGEGQGPVRAAADALGQRDGGPRRADHHTVLVAASITGTVLSQ